MHDEKNSLACRAALITVFGLALFVQSAQAQTFTVIHLFSGGGDGSYPKAGLTMDAAGSLHGTTFSGGAGFGIVFKLRHSGSGWVLTPLYSFAGGNDGANPYGRVTIAQDGSLYGTTYSAGDKDFCNGYGCGTVFHLKPSPSAPKSALASWNETVLFAFTGVYNGANPQGDLIFDQSGNIYGTAIDGGNQGNGGVYELTPSGGSWTETEVYYPGDNNLGSGFHGGVAFDNAGNLYGTSSYGGYGGAGNVYRLSPAGSGWEEQSLHQFEGNDGASPIGGLIVDPSGNLYGTTVCCGTGDGGTVFEITSPNGNWAFNTLYNFSTCRGPCGPQDKLVMDAAGNLYGTTWGGGAYGYGSVFKLTASNGDWAYTSLHDFTGGSDGGNPISNIVFDASGNLYGTASQGGGGSNCYPGNNGCGVVWEITP